MNYTTQSSVDTKKEENEKGIGDHASEFLGKMSSKLGSIGSMFSSTPTPPPTPTPTVVGGRKTRRGKSRKCAKCTKSRKCAMHKKSRKCTKCTKSRKCATHKKYRKR